MTVPSRARLLLSAAQTLAFLILLGVVNHQNATINHTMTVLRSMERTIVLQHSTIAMQDTAIVLRSKCIRGSR